MKKIITKLTSEQKQELVSDFLESLGKRLAFKRNKINLSQNDLADCLGIDRSTLSKYESGSRDMQVSMLPLLSVYCKFPMYELFPKNESQEILDTFSKAVSIIAERNKRKGEMQKKEDGEPFSSNSILNYVCERNIKEMRVLTDPQIPYKPSKEMCDEYKPLSDDEFCAFVQAQDKNVVDSIISAGQFLEKIEDIPHKDTLKYAVADYILDELVINTVTQDPSEINHRAYAYYKLLYYNKINSQNNE